MATDPVCKMQVNEATSVNRSFVSGQPYHFCSAECKSKFDQAPERFSSAPGASSGGRTESGRPRPEQQKQEMKGKWQDIREKEPDLKQKAQDLKEEVKSTAQGLKERTVEQSKSTIGTQKSKAAEGLGRMARVIRHTSENLQKEDQKRISDYADRLAERIEGASRYIREKNVDELVDDAGEFVQKQPALAFGGVFAMGFLFARFLKSASAAARAEESGPTYDV
jgi:YHS domain-containing protein